MNVALHVPRIDELDYRQKHLNEDPATMSYNRGYDIGIPEYDPETGCIAFPEEKWPAWYKRWCTGGDRYYAYIECDGSFVGEVSLHPDGGEDSYEMGIVLEACHRGKGYSRRAMELLLEHAFDEMKVRAVTNAFEKSREAALRLHISCGFEVSETKDDSVHLVLTGERYRSLKGKA